MRGYSVIACVSLKCPPNFGGVLRAASCYDAAMVILDAPRFHNGADNVSKTERHIPLVVGSVEESRPYGCEMVVVEITPNAKPLPDFKHPARAIYLFGPEDGSVPKRLIDKAQHVVCVPTAYCMNLAATVNVVLYDRLAKQLRHDRPLTFATTEEGRR